MSAFDTANKACGCDGTVTGCSPQSLCSFLGETEPHGGARRRRRRGIAAFLPLLLTLPASTQSPRWENNYFVIINVSMHDFPLIQFNYIVKQALSETTGA